MENLLFLLATGFALRAASSRRIGHQPIGDTGCSLLFMTGQRFERTLTGSSDELYFNEFREKGVSYGVICVDMKSSCPLPRAARMLVAYMRKLKGPFYIFYGTGIEKATDWNNIGSRSFVDYWQDAVGIDWKLRGYTNGRFLAVLYVGNIGEADACRVDEYLDSFHFPA